MRWLYHVTPAAVGFPHAPESLAREGFVHASFRSELAESVRLYHASIPPQDLRVMRIDPRRVHGLRIDTTPRGPMPHLYGAIPADAVRAVTDLDTALAGPDTVTGTRIVLAGFAGMTLLDLVGVLDPLGRIVTMKIDPVAQIDVVSLTAEPWEGFGATFAAPRFRPDLMDADVLVLAGGPETRRLREDPDVLAWLRSFPENRIASSVCTGALLLGAAGFLRGKRATTHHAELATLPSYGATAVAERVVDEGQLVTAGGVTSAIDLGLHLVRRLYGDAAHAMIAERIEWLPRVL